MLSSPIEYYRINRWGCPCPWLCACWAKSHLVIILAVVGNFSIQYPDYSQWLWFNMWIQDLTGGVDLYPNPVIGQIQCWAWFELRVMRSDIVMRGYRSFSVQILQRYHRVSNLTWVFYNWPGMQLGGCGVLAMAVISARIYPYISDRIYR
jgi:hypothetical protein